MKTIALLDICPNWFVNATTLQIFRFISGIDICRDDECWEWKRSTRTNGYGAFSLKLKGISAHRMAFLLFNGEIPDGLLVCHKCDNPKCCNPKHLFLGTSEDNNRDMAAKDRTTYGERNGNVKLTAEMVLNIRREYEGGGISFNALAPKYGVNRSTVTRAVRGETWGRLARAVAVVFASMLFSSCATRCYENGLPVLATYSNCSYLKFRTPKGTYLEIHNMDNSGPTRATGALVRDIGMSGILGGASLAVPH